MIGQAFCALLALTLAGAAQTTQPPAGDQTVATLTQLETVWNDAHLRADGAALAKLFADDLTVTVPGMPVMSKTQALEFLRSGRMKFDRYETSNIRVHLFGDAAVVNGRLLRTRAVNGQTVTDNWLFTKTYVQQGGTWQVVAFHASSND